MKLNTKHPFIFGRSACY